MHMRKSNLKILIIFSVINILSLSLKPSQSYCDKKNDNLLVSIDDEEIYDKELRNVFYQYNGTNTLKYSDIIDSSINEIIAKKMAVNSGLNVSEYEINTSLEQLKEFDNVLYKESVDLYGVNLLKDKLEERIYYNKFKNTILNTSDIVSNETINSFKNDMSLDNHLSNYSNNEIYTSLKKEIDDYAFTKFLEDNKENYNISYASNYNNFKNDIIIFNDDIVPDNKIDGKSKTLVNKDEIEFLNSIFEKNSEYVIKNANEILVKSDDNLYDKRLYLDGHLEKSNDRSKEIYFMVSKDKNFIDYTLDSNKKSIISGVDVYLSKAEDLNIDTQILLRAIFKVDKYNILLEAENIESREFLFYLENVINNVNTAVNKDKNLNNDEIEKYTKLSQAVKEAQLTIDAAKYLINNTPETIKSVRKELDLLIEKSENLIMKANKILQNIGMTDL